MEVKKVIFSMFTIVYSLINSCVIPATKSCAITPIFNVEGRRCELISLTNNCSNWLEQPVHWSENDIKFLTSSPPLLPYSQKQSLENILRNSDDFPIKFPVDTGRCKTLKNIISGEKLEQYINSAYPVLHEKALKLYINFLTHQRKFGTAQERKLYNNEIRNIPQFIDRLLLKRAAVFIGSNDQYLLKSGKRGAGNWEKIGVNDTEDQEPNFQSNLSYLEVKLSALLSISSYTYFVNDGGRYNRGKSEENRSKLQEEGVIIGLIGPRFERPLVMEYQEVIISKDQNTPSRGYGNHFVPTIEGVFLNFYGEPNLTYEDLRENLDKDMKYQKLGEGIYFNNKSYENRLSISFDTLLIEANYRAKKIAKLAFIHVVGIGLGVWAISPHQQEIFVDSFIKRIESLSSELHHISDVRFSYIRSQNKRDFIPIDGHPEKGIKIHFENVEPHLNLKDPRKLLVVSYAADGNSLPGNEYWLGALDASGDPAAAASTQIAELHTAEINPAVCGANLRIATLDNGLMKFGDYVAWIQSKINVKK